MAKQNYINHIALVLDASASMYYNREALIQVADSQIKYLAQRSKDLDQETRITVYVFNTKVECVIYDKDVLRLPSIREFYIPNGMTALIDATLKSQDDLALTPEIYGDHAFLTYVLTDGQENRSLSRPEDLLFRLNSLPSHWTVAVLVPDQAGKFEAKKFGFPSDNIAIWDSTSTKGVNEAGDKIRQATETFMVSRASGIRGSRSLFSTGVDAVNVNTIQAADLKPLNQFQYTLLPVTAESPIREWVDKHGLDYHKGDAFYQLTKTETIQPYKKIAIRNKRTGEVYTGQRARDLVGLSQKEERVKPTYNPEYDVFVQSTSVNRKLVPNTRLLLLF